MCCVMPPASPLATRVRRMVSSSDVLPVVDVAHHRHDGWARQQFSRVIALRFRQQRIRVVQLGGDRLVAHFLDHDHRRFLVQDLVDRDHGAHLHHRLDDFGGLHRQLVRKLGNRDRLRDRDFAHDRSGRAAHDVAAFIVAMTSTDLRAAPTCARRAGRVAAQLQRAPASGLFLEHLSRRLLGDAIALFTRLGGRTMQRAFGGGLRFRGGRFRGGGGIRSNLGGGRGGRFCLGGRFRRGFFGVAFLLGLACRFALLLFLDLFGLPLLQRLALARFFLARGDFLGRKLESGGLALRDSRCAGRRRFHGRRLDHGFRHRSGCDRSRLFRHGSGRSGGFIFAANQHALLAHLDLDRARLAGRIGGLDLRGLLARQRDALLGLGRGAMLLAQVIEQPGLIDLGELVALFFRGHSGGGELLQQRAGGHLEFRCELFDGCLRHADLLRGLRACFAVQVVLISLRRFRQLQPRPHSSCPLAARTSARAPS